MVAILSLNYTKMKPDGISHKAMPDLPQSDLAALAVHKAALKGIPIIAAYTAVAYYAFRGKADGLKYY